MDIHDIAPIYATQHDVEQITIILDKTNTNLEDLANEVLKIAKAVNTMLDRVERLERLIDQKVM